VSNSTPLTSLTVPVTVNSQKAPDPTSRPKTEAAVLTNWQETGKNQVPSLNLPRIEPDLRISVPPKEAPIYQPFFSPHEIDRILREDAELYDVSLLLESKVIEDDLMSSQKVVSKIVYCDGKYIKIYCTGFLNSKGSFSIKINAVCEDRNIQILNDELSPKVLKNICKLLVLREVLPHEMPLKHIKTFCDFCRICIFPFLRIVGLDEESRQSESSIEQFSI
jgi:hypothetical protein